MLRRASPGVILMPSSFPSALVTPWKSASTASISISVTSRPPKLGFSQQNPLPVKYRSPSSPRPGTAFTSERDCIGGEAWSATWMETMEPSHIGRSYHDGSVAPPCWSDSCPTRVDLTLELLVFEGQ